MYIPIFIIVILFAVAIESELPDNYKGRLTYDVYHTFLDDTENAKNRSFSMSDENNSNYWEDIAQNTLKDKLEQTLNTNKAKNAILFLGDGCSFSTWFATRLYMAQQQNIQGGEKYKMTVEHFPFNGLSKTYCVDSQVADSACTATAYWAGVKGNIGTIGVNGHVPYKNCPASKDPKTHTTSIARAFQKAGKRTGIVTTTRITHASPAGGYAHVASRNWENDAHVTQDNANPQDCPDIAMQLIHGDGRDFNVILGGGWQNLLPTTQNDPSGKLGQRADGRNLIDEWKQEKGNQGMYVQNRDELLGVTKVDHLLGIFATSHLDYNLNKVSTQPTLKEMTQAAIKQLSGEEGYFLFVEGGRIDHGHHNNRAKKALDETAAFDEAIAAAVDMTSREDTFIMVTSDHSHAMITSGYPHRGNNIFGIAGKGSDKIAYTTLSYGTGKYGFRTKNGKRYDVTNDDREDKNYRFPAFVPMSSAAHAGEDVGIFCSGPFAHLCSGVVEQNVIPHIIAYAACVGSGLKSCDNQNCLPSIDVGIDINIP